MSRDSQFMRVINAERYSLRENDGPLWKEGQSQIYARQVVKDPAFRRILPPGEPVLSVRVKESPYNRKPATWNGWIGNGGKLGLITIPPWARQPVVVLHELAHGVTAKRCCMLPAPHGPRFARVMFTLVRDFLGLPAARRFLDECDKRHVRIDWDWELYDGRA